jgi:DNA primase
VSYSDAKEQVRQATDIVDLVGRYLELRRSGRYFVGRCPWHDDRRPSLQVHPDRQTWKCWVCDIGGDVFSFVMKRENCDFATALRLLADRAGIALAERTGPGAAPGSPDDKATLYQCCAWATRQFQECLARAPEAEVARRYLQSRGIDASSIGRFALGFSPPSWTWLVERAKGALFSPAVLERVGLIARSSQGTWYDRFHGRLMFPIRDPVGRPIAFGGRVLPGQAGGDAAKYVNSPETPLYVKNRTLYALDLAREHVGRTRRITVVEGYTDVILCHQQGIGDVVACCGTALGEEHLQTLRRYADTVYLVLDGDAAGQTRTRQILELFVTAGVDLRIATLPDGQDPADFIGARGAQAWAALLDEAVDALEFKFRGLTRDLDVTRDTHRAHQALENLLETMARSARACGTDAAALRVQQMLTRLARYFALDEADVRQRYWQWLRAAAPRAGKLVRGASAAAALPKQPAEVHHLAALTPLERELFEVLVLQPELVPVAVGELADEELDSATAQALWGTYRRLEEAGQALDFQRVLTELEDPQLKHVLVQLDERAQEKSPKALLDGPGRLRSVLDRIRAEQEQRRLRQAQAALTRPAPSEEEERQVLAQVIAAKRRQQGIFLSTDG